MVAYTFCRAAVAAMWLWWERLGARPGDRPFNPCSGIARQACGELVTGAQIVYVNFDKATQSVRPVPEEIRRRIEAFDGVSFTSPV